VQNRHASFSVLLVVTACEAGNSPLASRQRAPVTTVQKPPAATAAPAAAPKRAGEHPDNPNGVQWHGSIEWHEWSAARDIANRSSKPIMVVVYADWCPHCRALGPVFADPEVETLSKRFVMVRQNHDDSPAWLEPYNQKFGGYVPRIFFFDQNGKMREDLTSGHPRYPYFYAAEQPEFLKRSMRQAAGS
jgi:thiol:disulfide interchange protein